MTMNDMVKKLEREGFIVEKSYSKELQAYKFAITKNGATLNKLFKFPHGNDFANRDRIQREFILDMIREFELTYEDVKRYFYMGKPYYIDEKGEEKEMTHYEKYHVAAKKDKDVKRFLNMLCNLNYDGTSKPVAIEKVVFNDPATIILWTDGSKTVVKCENETYDPEKGMAMAICKKVLGNEGNYFNEFKKWLPKEEVETDIINGLKDGLNTPTTPLAQKMVDAINKKYSQSKPMLKTSQLWEIMASKDVSFTELSKRTGIPAGRLIKYHRGEIKPKQFTINKIKDALGVEQLKFDI